jgi:hypothetical protein
MSSTTLVNHAFIFMTYYGTNVSKDAKTVPSRPIPSLLTPEKAFTLRYFEFRLLLDPVSIKVSCSTICGRCRCAIGRTLAKTSRQKVEHESNDASRQFAPHRTMA